MLAMYLAGSGLWLVYGLLNGAIAVIAANVVAMTLVSAIVLLKIRRRSPGARDTPAAHRHRHGRSDGRCAGGARPPLQRALRSASGDRGVAGPSPGGGRPAGASGGDRGAAGRFLLRRPRVLPDCRDVIAELAARHEVVIASAAMDVPCSFDAKYRWLQRHFPFIPPSNIVFCGDKAVVNADYLIDDRARHFARFKGRPLLFSAPHNAAETRYPRVESWADVREFFGRIDSAAARETRPSVRAASLPSILRSHASRRRSCPRSGPDSDQRVDFCLR